MKNHLQKTPNATVFLYIKHQLRDHPLAATKSYKKQRVCHESHWLNAEYERCGWSLTIILLEMRFFKKPKQKSLFKTTVRDTCYTKCVLYKLCFQTMWIWAVGRIQQSSAGTIPESVPLWCHKGSQRSLEVNDNSQTLAPMWWSSSTSRFSREPQTEC